MKEKQPTINCEFMSTFSQVFSLAPPVMTNQTLINLLIKKFEQFFMIFYN